MLIDRFFHTSGRISSLLALFFFLGIASSQAQPTGRPPAADGVLSGSVRDSDSGEPIATATIAVWSQRDSSLVTGAVSDLDGNFAIEQIRAGEYYVNVSFVGYESAVAHDVTISREKPRVSLGAIQLAPDLQQMEGVEVVAEREAVTFEIDRTVYNTKDQITSSGGSASDVLQNIPSVEVDIDGNVSLRGNQNVVVYINGKPSPVRGDFLASYLQQIPAGTIEKVEVIPNPSAKFDPDGMAGIINLVMKQDTDLGTSGGLTFGIGTGDSYNASGNLNFQKGKLSLFSNYGFRFEDRLSEGYNFRENRYLDPLTYLEQNEDGSRERLSNMINLNADYALNKKDILSASAQMGVRGGDNDGLNTFAQLGSGSELTGLYDRGTASSSQSFNMDYKLGFKRTIETSKHELSADLRFSRSTEDEEDLFTQQLRTLDGAAANATPELQSNVFDNLENELTGQLDYVRPLGAGKLEAGYKGTLQILDNTLFSETFDYGAGAYRPDVDINNDFTFDQQVHAAYGTVSGSVGKLDLQGGVRLEQVLTTFDLSTTAERFDNDYFSVYPSAFASYKLSDTRAVRLSYSKRVQRPRTRMLNPFANYSDPLNLFVGNPSLKPEYVHAYELALQQFSNIGSLSLAPYYRKTINQMERFKTLDPRTGISTTTFENFDSSESWGAETIGSLRLGQKLNGFASFNLYKVVTNGSNLDTDLGNSAISWSTRLNATWQVRPGLDIQASYFYRAPTDVAQGRISAFSRADLSVRQKFMGDKASLTLRVSDPFDQMGFKFIVDDNTFYQLGERKWQSRNAYLTFTYNFGRQPQRRDRNQNDGGGEMGGDMGIN